MKQLSQNLRSGKLSVDNVPQPGLQPGQVLVQTTYSLISTGTERSKIETGRKSLVGKALARPDQVRQVLQSVSAMGLQATYQKVVTRLDSRSPMGYSASGVVLSVGTGVDDIQPGDKVACGGASAAHAEIMTIPHNLCVRVPDGVDLDAAAFTTVGAIALQGIRQADLRLGEVVVVIGLGLLGQLTVQMLRASGCTVLGFDPDPGRCELALSLGIDIANDSENTLKGNLNAYTHSKGADAVIITAGTSSNRPVELAGELAREKGSVVVVGAVGLQLPRAPYYDKELKFSISRSYGPGRYDPVYEEKGQDYPYGYVRWTEKRNMEAFLRMLATRKVDVSQLITHRFSLDKAEDAYSLISGQFEKPSLGVLFEYSQAPLPNKSRIEINPEREKTPGSLSIGVIGAGNFAQSMLLPNLQKHPNTFLGGVATATPLDTRDVAERFGFNYAAASADDLLNDKDIQALLIATRHDSHSELVIKGLRLGKAIYVEKPLAMSPDQLSDIRKIYYEIANPFLMVGFNRRFAPMVQQARHFFNGCHEPLAMNFRINAGFVPNTHWAQDSQQGGGRIIGEVCHFIDLMQFFSDALVKRVYAQSLPNHDKYNNDNVAITIGLTDGSVGTILYVANGDKVLPKEYLEIFSDGKVAIIDDYRSLTLYNGGRKKISHHGVRDKGHKNEMIAWVNAVREGKLEPVPFKDSVAATSATFAVIRSLTEGQVVLVDHD